MRFNCLKCKKPLNVRGDLAGKQVRCPSCGTTIPVPAAGAGAAGATGSCSGCGTALPDGAVVCIQCGLDLRTGKKLDTVFADDPASPPPLPGTPLPPPMPGGVPPLPPGSGVPQFAPPSPSTSTPPGADTQNSMPTGFQRTKMGDPEARRKKAEKTKRLVKLGVLGVGVILFGLGARAIMSPSKKEPEKEQPPTVKKKKPAKKKGRRRVRKKPPLPKPKPAPTVVEKDPEVKDPPEPGEAPPSPEETAQVKATAALSRSGPGGVPRLVEALKYPSWRVRRTAAAVLGTSLPAAWKKSKRWNPRKRKVNRGWDIPLRKAFVSGEAVTALAAACRDEDERVRAAAEKALLALYGAWVDPKEAAASGDATALEVTFDLVEAGRLETEKAAVFLSAVLAVPGGAGRARAAKLLARGDYSLALAVPALLKGVKESEGELLEAFASSLRSSIRAKPAVAADAPEVRGALLEALEDEAAGPLAAELLEVALLARPEVVAEIKNEAEQKQVLDFVETRMREKFIAALSKAIDKRIRTVKEAVDGTDAKWEAFVDSLVPLAPLSGFALVPHLDPKAESEVTRGPIRERARAALIKLGPGALAALHEAFDMKNDRCRAECFGILRAIATDKKHAKVRASLAAAYRSEPKTAAAAAPAVRYLIARLGQEKATAREDAARVLGLLGPAAKDAVAPLTRVLESDPAQREVKSARNPGFGETGPAKYYFVRAAAAAALGEIGAAAKSALPALKAALKDTHLRASAFEALKKIQAAAASGSVANGPKTGEAAWRVTLADGKIMLASEVETYERATGTMVKIVRTDGMVLHLRKDEVKIERLTPGGKTPGGVDESTVAIRLKDGRTFSGRLLEETDEKIVIEYRRGSIKMRMSFLKKDVQTVSRAGEKTE